MRGYALVHCIISGVQCGLQGGHALVEMMDKYRDSQPGTLAHQSHIWAKYDKTLIVLNGGTSANLFKLLTLLESDQNPFPFAYFKESFDFAEGMLTAIALTLPEEDVIEDQAFIDIDPDFYYHLKTLISELRRAQ